MNLLLSSTYVSSNVQSLKPPNTTQQAPTERGFPWHGPARKVEEPRVPEDVSIIAPNLSHDQEPTLSASTMPFMSTPRDQAGGENSTESGTISKKGSPPSGRTSRASSMWLLPPDQSYAGGGYESISADGRKTPRLKRSMTSGTTPEIGVEPPVSGFHAALNGLLTMTSHSLLQSHSPTTIDEESRVMDNNLLTPAGVLPPPPAAPRVEVAPQGGNNQANNYQGPIYHTPVYGRPTDDDAASNADFQYYSPSIRQSIVLPASFRNPIRPQPTTEWAPPPIVPLSPIPGTAPATTFHMSAPYPGANMDNYGTVIGSRRQGLDEGILGLTSGAEGDHCQNGASPIKRLDVFDYGSPAPLDRPFSIFSESDAGS